MKIDGGNGWMAWGRLVTPAFLGVLVWIVTAGLGDVKASMTRIETHLRNVETDVKVLSNDYLHTLGDIKDRLGKIEGRNVILNGVVKERR